MNKWWKRLIWVTVILVLGGIGFILWGPGNTMIDPEATQTGFQSIHFIHEEDGRKVIEVFAESGSGDVEEKIGKVQNIKALFFRKDGTQWQMTAPSGQIDDRGNQIVLDAPVHVEDLDGSYITSGGEGRFSVKEKVVYLEGGIKAVRKDIVLTGETLQADIELSQIKVRGNQARLRKGGTIE